MDYRGELSLTEPQMGNLSIGREIYVIAVIWKVGLIGSRLLDWFVFNVLNTSEKHVITSTGMNQFIRTCGGMEDCLLVPC